MMQIQDCPQSGHLYSRKGEPDDLSGCSKAGCCQRKVVEAPNPEKDVPVNACVVHDKKTDKYFVFMTTDTCRTARQTINTYELRPEIEEDFRQMKDFWKLEVQEHEIQLYHLPHRDNTGGIPLFPSI